MIICIYKIYKLLLYLEWFDYDINNDCDDFSWESFKKYAGGFEF